MSLHVLAAINCSLGRFDEAVPVLERAVSVPDAKREADHALAAFSGHMQLGDTYSMLGLVDRSIQCYKEGLRYRARPWERLIPELERPAGYLAEAHVQGMQFDEAEELCKKTLEIHHAPSEPASLEVTADCQLMALVCKAKGDYEGALEHLALASMSMIANGQENEVAAIDVSIGNIYLALCLFDEAVFSYQKALSLSQSSSHQRVSTTLRLALSLYALLMYTTGLESSVNPSPIVRMP